MVPFVYLNISGFRLYRLILLLAIVYRCVYVVDMYIV